MLFKLGSTGPAVTAIQKALGLVADGAFGIKTQSRVKEIQSSKGLTPSGEVDDSTWSIIFPESGIKIQKLKGVLPDSVFSQLEDTIRKFNINSTLRLAHFLAQCAHESGNFRVVTENLNYRADLLKQIFPRYFPEDTSLAYANNPEKIANRVYASRMGNGPESSGDGYRYRGRGYIQLTGKTNYTRFGQYIGEDVLSNPDLVATRWPLQSAAFFFDYNSLWTICDRGPFQPIVEAVTLKVNGGTHGLAERQSHFDRFYTLLK